MTSRLLASVGVLATVIAVVWLGAVSLARVPVAGQPSRASVGWVADSPSFASANPPEPSAEAGASGEGAQAQTPTADTLTLPRTPWGHPDLQGIWNNSTNTPLERLTAEERERGRRAQEPVRRATEGTGAAWPESGGQLEQASLIVDPPDGRIPMKAEAVRRLVAREEARRGRGEADSWLDRNSWERCISRTLPVAMIPNLYNNNYLILQTPQHVVILMEMIHEARIIPLDGRSHVVKSIRQWLGDSRGHWEGDTLVVETINFNDKLDGGEVQPSHVIQTGHRGSGATLRLVERFTRTDAHTIDYRFTVEDPQTFTRPYTVAIPMRKRDNQDPLYEYACHEGNYAMVNLLKSGRADEQAALEASERVSRQRIEAGHPGIREPAVPIVPPAPPR
jgi:hypothetical protein